MAIDYETKKAIKEELESQDITLHCTRATCMESFILNKGEYKRLIEEEGGAKCPRCGYRSL